MSDLSQRDYGKVQIFLAQHSPFHLMHVSKETGGDKSFSASGLVMHFASHQNLHGRSFASVFARLYSRHKEDILSNDNLYFAGEFFKKPPTQIEATLYYFAYHKKFGLSLKKLSLIVVKIF